MRSRHHVQQRGIEDGRGFQVPRYVEELTKELKGGYRGLLRSGPYVDFMVKVEEVEIHEEDAMVAEDEGEQGQAEVEDMTPEGAALLEALARKRKDQQATPKAKTHGAHPQIKWQPDNFGGRPVPMRPEHWKKISNIGGQEGNLRQSAGAEPTRQKPRRAVRKRPRTALAYIPAVAGDLHRSRASNLGGQRPQPLSLEDDLPQNLPLCVTPIRSLSPLNDLPESSHPVMTPIRSPSPFEEEVRRSPTSTSFTACRLRNSLASANGNSKRELSPAGRRLSRSSPREPPEGLRIVASILPPQSRLAHIKENGSPSAQTAGIAREDESDRAVTPTGFNEDFWSHRDIDRPVSRPTSPTSVISDNNSFALRNNEVGTTTTWSSTGDDLWHLKSSSSAHEFERQISPPPPQQTPAPSSVRAFLKRRSSHAFADRRHDELTAFCGAPLSHGEPLRRKSFSCFEEDSNTRQITPNICLDAISNRGARVDIFANRDPKNPHRTERILEHQDDQDKDGEEKEEALPGVLLGRATDTSSPQLEERLRLTAAQCGAQEGIAMKGLQPPCLPDGSSNVEPRRFPSYNPSGLQPPNILDSSSSATEGGLPSQDLPLISGNSQALALEGNSSNSWQQGGSAQNSQQSAGPIDHGYKVIGAGGIGEMTNGFYRRVGVFNGMPKYKQLGGDAIIYYFGAWKINYHDDTDGWFYLHLDDQSQSPPEGMWTTEGYCEGNADPAPVVRMSKELFEESSSQAASGVPALTQSMDEQDQALLHQGSSLQWTWKQSDADHGSLQGNGSLSGMEQLTNSKEALRMDEEEERNIEYEDATSEHSKNQRNQQLQLQMQAEMYPHRLRHVTGGHNTSESDQQRDFAPSRSLDEEDDRSIAYTQEWKHKHAPNKPHSWEVAEPSGKAAEPLNVWLMQNQIQEMNRHRAASPFVIGPRSAGSPLEDLDAPLARVLGALARAPAIKDVRRPPSAGKKSRVCSATSPEIRLSPLPSLSPRGCSTTTTVGRRLVLIASSQQVQPPQQVSTDTGTRQCTPTPPCDWRQLPRKALGTSLLCMLPPSRASTRRQVLAQAHSHQLQQQCREGKMVGLTTDEEPKFDSMLSDSFRFEGGGADLNTLSVQSSHVYSFSEEDRY